MLKKSIAISFAMSIASFAHSGAMGTELSPSVSLVKENLYVGLGFGGRFAVDKLSENDSQNSFNSHQTTQVSGVVGNVYLGVGHTWMNRYFLGIEANTYFPSYTTKFSLINYYQRTSSYAFMFKDYIGVDALPGIRWNENALIYARLGLSSRDISLSINGHSTGGRFGLGLAHNLTQHLGVAIDYFFTYYPNFKYYQDPINGSIQDSLNAYQNYVGLSLVYSS